MIKRVYEKPIIEIQQFCPNEFISSCFKCDASLPSDSLFGGTPSVLVVADNDHNNKLSKGDTIMNPIKGSGSWPDRFQSYTPCNQSLVYQGEDIIDGFLIYNHSYTRRPYLWDTDPSDITRYKGGLTDSTINFWPVKILQSGNRLHATMDLDNYMVNHS